MPAGKRILFLNRKPPHGSLALKESLDAALVAASFGQQVSLLFQGDGVFQLMNHQCPQSLGCKDHGAMFAGLDLYEIDRIFVDDVSLNKRGLSENDLRIAVTTLSKKQIKALFATQDAVLSY